MASRQHFSIRTYIFKVMRKQNSCVQLPMTCCISSVVLCTESSVPNVPTVVRNKNGKVVRWLPKHGHGKASRVSSILYIDYDGHSNIKYTLVDKVPIVISTTRAHSVFRPVQIYLYCLLISRRWCHVHFAPRRCLYHH